MVLKNFFIWLSLTTIIFTYTNCKKFEASSQSLSSSSSSLGVIGSIEGLSLSSLENIDINLFDEKTLEITVTSLNNYSGDVNLSVDRNELTAVTGNQDISFSFEPQSISLSAGGSASSVLTIKTKDSAPSFDVRAIRVVANANGSTSATQETGLSVKAILEMKMFGGPIPNQRWDKPTMMVLRQHTPGVQLRYINYDTTTAHTVHASGAIRHQPTAVPLSPATDSQTPGGVYEHFVAENETRDGVFYYHNLGDTGNSRTIKFNQAAANITSSSAVRTLASVIEDSQDNSSAERKGTGNCHEE